MPEPVEPVEPTAVEPTEPVEPAQADTDWKAEARKWEARAKENQLAAASLKALEDAQKTEQERLEERASQAEQRAAALELDANRATVALEKGLTAAQAKRLVGSSFEELAADADQLLIDLGNPASRKPAADPSQGPKAAVGAQDPAEQFAEIIRAKRGL